MLRMALAILALALAGCTRAPDRQDVREVVSSPILREVATNLCRNSGQCDAYGEDGRRLRPLLGGEAPGRGRTGAGP